MKKLLFLTIMAVCLSACQTATNTKPVDTAASKAEVNALLDKFHSSFQSRDVTGMMNLLTDNGLFCGTDSKELLNKEEFNKQTTQSFTDAAFVPKYTLDRREIRIESDGNSGIALDQFIFHLISEKIPCRQIFHLVKINNEWKIDFASWSLIPNNEDIGKLNKALE